MMKRVRAYFLILLLVFPAAVQWMWPSDAHEAPRPKGPVAFSRIVPSPVLKWPEKGPEYAIVVEKVAQKVHVFHRDNPRTPIKTYPCSTGENGGAKTRMNDRKTPEGVYFVIKSYVEKDLSPIYGARAFPLDYPNPIDKKEGRGGYGIWFHGTNKPLKPRDTNGCIVLENNNINDLARYITLYETPIIISAKMPMADQTIFERESKELEQRIEAWRRAWEGKDIDEYMALYHPTFSTGSKNWDQYKDYKTRLAKQYERISVDIDNLSIVRNDGLVVASFHQTYRTSSFQSTGIKRLYLQQNSKEWKITREEFEGKDLTQVVVKKPRPTPRETIEAFLERWKAAWEKEDLKDYMACYDRTFISRGMNRWAWKKHRQRLNSKFSSVRVDIRDIDIQDVSQKTAQVTFVQDYRADQYQDFGLKTISLIRRGQEWKIKKEEWEPLEEKSLQ